jgi:hypothetical protein
MYVDFQTGIIAALIIFAFGSLSAFALSSFILRRYVSLKSYQSLEYELSLEQKKQLILKQREELAVKTAAIQRLVYEANHKGFIPLCKTLRGLLALVRMSCTNTRTVEYVDKCEELVLSIEKEVMREVREIENLQE